MNIWLVVFAVYVVAQSVVTLLLVKRINLLRRVLTRSSIGTVRLLDLAILALVKSDLQNNEDGEIVDEFIEAAMLIGDAVYPEK
jgi:hypothetical protein